MIRKPDDYAIAYMRALAEEYGDRAREKAARATGILWGGALGTLIGLAAFLLGWT